MCLRDGGEGGGGWAVCLSDGGEGGGPWEVCLSDGGEGGGACEGCSLMTTSLIGPREAWRRETASE